MRRQRTLLFAAAEATAGRRQRVCVVQGASRGLGLELTRQLAARGDVVFATCREPVRAEALHALKAELPNNIAVLQLDATDAASVKAAAAEFAAHPLSSSSASSSSSGVISAAVDLLVNTAGVLEDKGRGIVPERSLGQVDEAAVAASFATNALGPLLVAQAFAPLLRRAATLSAGASENEAPAEYSGSGSSSLVQNRCHARAIFYSARVGSIGDNNSRGGWYAYRGSKAALNQFVRCMALELRKHDICCVALHPGTVDTDLTRAFAKARAKYDVQTAEDAVRNHLEIIDGLSMEDTGTFLDWRRKQVPW